MFAVKGCFMAMQKVAAGGPTPSLSVLQLSSGNVPRNKDPAPRGES